MAERKKYGNRQSTEIVIVPVAEIPREMESTPTNLVEIYKVCRFMEVLCEQSGGIGLAAPQVGLPWRVYVVRQEDGHYDFFVDCNYIPSGSSKVLSTEGCLSLKHPDGSFIQFIVERNEKVRLVGKQLINEQELKDIDIELVGLYSIVHQHEADHTKGFLISDIGRETHCWR
jgi:peptide deformylase